MKRPLCFFAVAFVVLVIIVQIFPIPFPLGSVSESYPLLTEGQQVYLTGTLYKKEVKNDRLIYYLKSISVQETEFRFHSNPNPDQNQNSNQNQNTNQNPNLNENPGERRINGSRKTGAVCYMEQSEMSYPIGVILYIEGTAFPFAPAENDGQFDGKAYYENIGYGIRLTKCRVVATGNVYDFLGQKLVNIKQWITGRYRMYMTEENAGTLSAMLLGNKEVLQQEVKELYRRNGISHILAISGLHISMLGMLGYRLLRRVGVLPPVCAVSSIFLVLVYIKVIGAGVSSFRAACMFLLCMAADFLRRTYDLRSALALSASLWLLAHPADVFQAGFLFSYSAVLSLAVVDPVLQEAGRKRENFLRKQRRRRRHCLIEFFCSAIRRLQTAMISSLSVQVFLFPLTLWFYYEFPIYSFLLNLIVIPCMSVLFICGILGALPIPGSFAALVTADKLLQLYSWLCRQAEALPGAVIVTGRPKLWQMVLYYTLVVGWLFWHGRKEWSGGSLLRLSCLQTGFLQRVLLRFGGTCMWQIRFPQFLVPLCCMLLFFIPLQGEDRMDMLSVGQGDCVCMRDAAGHVALIDAGSTDVSDVGKYRLLPFLKYHGIDRVDVAFLSHAHEDHYSAICQILELGSKEGIQIGTLCLIRPEESSSEKETYDTIAELARRAGCKVVWLQEGDMVAVGDMKFTVVYPPAHGDGGAVVAEENDRSMVLLGSLKEFQVLFTGDCSVECDSEIIRKLQQMGIRKIHCLKVAHHGAQTSTSEELLTAFDFDLALISCGADNSYGHPHANLVQRLEEAGCHIFTTPEHGQITVKIRKGTFKISSWMDRRKTL